MDDASAGEHSLAIAIQYARSAERLIAAVATLMPAADALTRLSEFDPDLKPEIAVAFAHVGEALEALKRASTFQEARFDAAVAALDLDPPLQEGDTQ